MTTFGENIHLEKFQPYAHICANMREYIVLAQFGATAWPSLIDILHSHLASGRVTAADRSKASAITWEIKILLNIKQCLSRRQQFNFLIFFIATPPLEF